MTIDECLDILISHSVCVRHMATCGKHCARCSVVVSDDVAMDALRICKSTKPYTIKTDKAS